MTEQPVVLITGASMGIGKVTAERLVKAGYRVFGTSRNAQDFGNGVTMLVLDVQKSETILSCVNEVLSQAGKIDILINNAGIVGAVGATEEISLTQYRDIFETNFFGMIALTKAVLPHMRQRGSGRIINMSSAAGFTVAPPYFTAYCASKHALEAFTEGLRYDAQLLGIKVSLLQFGFMRTNIDASIVAPETPLPTYEPTRSRAYLANLESLKRGRDPVVVAEAVERVLGYKNPRLRYRIGIEVWYLNILKRFTPFEVSEFFIKQMFFVGNWTVENMGWRLLLLDTKVIDQTVRVAFIVLIVALVLLIDGLMR